MGMKRMALRMLVPGYGVARQINMMKKHGMKKGIEMEANDLINDTPIVGHLLREGQRQGRYEGKKEGYIDASKVYEKKMKEQANRFLAEKNKFSETIDDYESLLDELQLYIQSLERKKVLSIDEEADLEQAIELQHNLEASHGA